MGLKVFFLVLLGIASSLAELTTKKTVNKSLSNEDAAIFHDIFFDPTLAKRENLWNRLVERWRQIAEEGKRNYEHNYLIGKSEQDILDDKKGWDNAFQLGKSNIERAKVLTGSIVEKAVKIMPDELKHILAVTEHLWLEVIEASQSGYKHLDIISKKCSELIIVEIENLVKKIEALL